MISNSKKMSNFIINTPQVLKKKLELVESLSEVSIAKKLLDDTSKNVKINPLDQHYKKLKSDIQPLNTKGSEFQMVKDYVKNTHAKTHSNYSLEVLDVFKLERGEQSRFDKCCSNMQKELGGKKNSENRWLLWHGSRLTNFVGIVSQGLRIAPPEAPVTGYMFGKGVYFADMVSKSANYCWTSKANPIGLMLLCEVAIGKPRELLQADYYANNLPAGHHSTKGCGATHPGGNVKENGLTIPLKAPKTGARQGALLYNEYIVYDVAQIKMKYMIKMRFDWKW